MQGTCAIPAVQMLAVCSTRVTVICNTPSKYGSMLARSTSSRCSLTETSWISPAVYSHLHV
ncbi:unnamed protein product [Periconia digitata]|uniref:Uncharacterized protein n=1 Tax=Periconia digitata TaxID=1303443 RepID=A0A9W4XEE7_9PLEO|nr:unnamed protein product [Periconia digitata]